MQDVIHSAVLYACGMYLLVVDYLSVVSIDPGHCQSHL